MQPKKQAIPVYPSPFKLELGSFLLGIGCYEHLKKITLTKDELHYLYYMAKNLSGQCKFVINLSIKAQSIKSAT